MSATDKTYIDNVTSFAAADANSITLDINNAVTSSAQVLNGTSNNQTAVTMNTYSHNGQSYTAGGSVNTYTLTQAQSTLHAILAYVDGTKVRFRAGVTNTGGSTVDVSSAGVKDIMTSAGVALVGGEIQAGAWIELTYDSGDGAFLITSSSVAAAALVPRGYLSGFGMSNNSSDDEHDIDFAAGVASDLAGAGTITNIAAGVSMTKQLDNVWVQGTSLGGRASGVALAINTWYRCFAIANTGGTVDFGFDTSATAANLLLSAQAADATYAYARQVGWILTDGSKNIISFLQRGDEFYLQTMFTDGQRDSSTTVTLVNLGAPPSNDCLAKITMFGLDYGSDRTRLGLLLSTEQTHGTVDSANCNIGCNEGAVGYPHQINTAYITVPSDASSQAHVKWSGNNVYYTLNTTGWIDTRGKG